MTVPIITVDRLVKRYKNADRNAVDGISFSVRPGELFALLGPNGAGKTSTISILTTTLSLTSGQVTINGHDLIRDAAAVRRSIGIVFQQPSLDLNLTAEENVRLHAILYGLYPFRPSFGLMPRAYREQVRELASLLGIQDELFRPLKAFSGGMRRKLEIVQPDPSEDRENDFSQEIFVSPISRYSIVFGKNLGESLVALAQGVGIILFGAIVGVPMSLGQLLALVPVAIIACLLGASFGILVLSNLSSRRLASQVFPFIMLPQFFLAGVFNPIKILPLPLVILSLLSPMRYVVDLARGTFYFGQPEYEKVVLQPPLVNLAIMGAMFAVFLVAGTVLFVRREQNR